MSKSFERQVEMIKSIIPEEILSDAMENRDMMAVVTGMSGEELDATCLLNEFARVAQGVRVNEYSMMNADSINKLSSGVTRLASVIDNLMDHVADRTTVVQLEEPEIEVTPVVEPAPEPEPEPEPEHEPEHEPDEPIF